MKTIKEVKEHLTNIKNTFTTKLKVDSSNKATESTHNKAHSNSDKVYKFVGDGVVNIRIIH